MRFIFFRLIALMIKAYRQFYRKAYPLIVVGFFSSSVAFAATKELVTVKVGSWKLTRPLEIFDGELLAIELQREVKSVASESLVARPATKGAAVGSPVLPDFLIVEWFQQLYKAYPEHVQMAGTGGEAPTTYRAFLAVPLGASTKAAALKVFGVRNLGQEQPQYQLTAEPLAVFQLPIKLATYPSTKLTVDPKYSKPPPPRVVVEKANIQAAMVEKPIFAPEQEASSLALPRLWQGSFLKPVPGGYNSNFGVKRLFNRELRSRHLGVDMQGAVGTPILAANDGVVALAAADYYFMGNAVILNHGDNLFTLYMHLSELLVKTGDHVKKGDVLGKLGATGRVTGPHLHFGVKLQGVYVNPVALFDL